MVQEVPRQTEATCNGGLQDKGLILVVFDHQADAAAVLPPAVRPYRTHVSHGLDSGLAEAAARLPNLVVIAVGQEVAKCLALCSALSADRRTYHIPVLLLSAHASRDLLLDGLMKGAEDVLGPGDGKLLRLKIQNLLARQRRLSKDQGFRLVMSAANVSVRSEAEEFLARLHQALDLLMAESRYRVAELAWEMGYSRRQLYRRLMAITGCTPGRLMGCFRLKRVACLLRHSVGNIAQIAFMTGFKTSRQLSADFRRTYGQTPKEYAAREKSGQWPSPPELAGSLVDDDAAAVVSSSRQA